MPTLPFALSPTQCFLNAIVQCLSHTRGLRDYCLLKPYRQEKFIKEDAKLTEGMLPLSCFSLLFLLFIFSHCLLSPCASFLSGAVRPLGWEWRGHSCKSTTVLQSFQRSGAILQWLQVGICSERADCLSSAITCSFEKCSASCTYLGPRQYTSQDRDSFHCS